MENPPNGSKCAYGSLTPTEEQRAPLGVRSRCNRSSDLIFRIPTADSTVRSPVRALLFNRKVQVLLNGGLGLGLLAIGFFSAKHFIHGGWPLHHADPILVVSAALLFLIAYAFKAWGWQRLFNEHERPG